MLPYPPTCGLTGGGGWTCRLLATPSRRRDKPHVWAVAVSCQSLCLERRDRRCPSQAIITAHASPPGRRWLGSRREQAGKRPDPAHRVLQGKAVCDGCFQPLPSPSSQACLSCLAPRPCQIPLHRSAGTSSCFLMCPPAWGKLITQLQIMSFHLATGPSSPGDKTLFLWGCMS